MQPNLQYPLESVGVVAWSPPNQIMYADIVRSTNNQSTYFKQRLPERSDRQHIEHLSGSMWSQTQRDLDSAQWQLKRRPTKVHTVPIYKLRACITTHVYPPLTQDFLLVQFLSHQDCVLWLVCHRDRLATSGHSASAFRDVTGG